MSFHFVIEFQKGIHSWVLLFSAFCISAVWYIKCVPGEEFVHGLLCVGKSSAKKIIVGIFCTPKVDWRACVLKVEHFNLLVGQLYVAVNQVFVRDLCSAHFATIVATQKSEVPTLNEQRYHIFKIHGRLVDCVHSCLPPCKKNAINILMQNCFGWHSPCDNGWILE